jgi:hypothetical protein
MTLPLLLTGDIAGGDCILADGSSGRSRTGGVSVCEAGSTATHPTPLTRMLAPARLNWAHAAFSKPVWAHLEVVYAGDPIPPKKAARDVYGQHSTDRVGHSY